MPWDLLASMPRFDHDVPQLRMKNSFEARRHFASDNYAGICPEAWAALAEANHGHAVSYGDDPWTARAADLIREVFETHCEVFFVFNGTAANSLSLASTGQSYHSILCHEIAHVETDECGAPEFFSNGMKVLQVPGANGKIDPAGIERMVKKRSDVHYPKPRAVSLTQATEVGTVYSVEEVKAIWAKTKSLGLMLHMDGARFANAVASLGVQPKEITWQAGVDVLCFGGTKNGTHVGDAVVFFNRELGTNSTTAASRRGSCARRCDFFPRRGPACCRTARGCAAPRMPTRWRGGCTMRCREFPRSKSCFRRRPTPCSPICRRTSSTRCDRKDGSFTRSSARAAAG